MTRGFLAIGLTTAVAALAACVGEHVTQAPAPQKTVDSPSLQQQLEEQRRSNELQRRYIEDVTSTLNDVEDRLREVAPIEKELARVSIGAERGESIEPTQREKVLSKIAAVKSALDADSQRLSELRTRSATFSGRIAGLEATVVRLQATIRGRNDEIAHFRESIARMSDEVNALRNEKSEHVEELERRRNEISQSAEDLRIATAERDRGFILIGRITALLQLGVLIETKRIFRKPLFSLPATPETSKFTPIDTRQNVRFEVPAVATSIHLYPARSQDLYRVVQNADGTSTLLIEMPDRFWLTRYVVVTAGE